MPLEEKLLPDQEVVAEKLWSEKEVAAYLGLTVKALQKRRNKGQPPPYLKLGRVVRYRKEDVDASLVKIQPGEKEAKAPNGGLASGYEAGADR